MISTSWIEYLNRDESFFSETGISREYLEIKYSAEERLIESKVNSC